MELRASSSCEMVVSCVGVRRKKRKLYGGRETLITSRKFGSFCASRTTKWIIRPERFRERIGITKEKVTWNIRDQGTVAATDAAWHQSSSSKSIPSHQSTSRTGSGLDAKLDALETRLTECCRCGCGCGLTPAAAESI